MTNPNNVLLYRLRTLTQAEEPTREQWHELVELFDALDANLCGGGPFPTVWTAEYIRAQLRKIAKQVTAEFMGEARPPTLEERAQDPMSDKFVLRTFDTPDT